MDCAICAKEEERVGGKTNSGWFINQYFSRHPPFFFLAFSFFTLVHFDHTSALTFLSYLLVTGNSSPLTTSNPTPPFLYKGAVIFFPRMALLALPTDLIHEILTFTDNHTFVAILGTCRHLRQLHNSQRHPQISYWKTLHVIHQVLERRANVLLHGPGGCGKTFALSHLFAALQKANETHTRAYQRVMVFTGTTGNSACHLPQGVTLHSFAGLGKATLNIDALRTLLESKPIEQMQRRFAQWIKTDILVIDEISMLGSRLLEKLSLLAQTIRGDFTQPFGGMQIVASGDFLQLPPVGDKFVFESDVWQALQFHHVAFDVSYRQKHDRTFFHMLQRIRFGAPNARDIQLLSQRRIETIPESWFANIGSRLVAPLLFSRHMDVDRINQERFDSFEGPVISLPSEDRWVQRVTTQEFGKNVSRMEPYHGPALVMAPNLLDQMNRKLLPVLNLKVGAQYIITYNCNRSKSLINGRRCICRLTDETRPLGVHNICLELENGTRVHLQEVRIQLLFPVEHRSNVFISRVQYALRLGYATTIHASQGMTLDEAIMDLGTKIFARAQPYVGLSRVRACDKVHLLQFDPKCLKANAKALAYVKQHFPNDIPKEVLQQEQRESTIETESKSKSKPPRSKRKALAAPKVKKPRAKAKEPKPKPTQNKRVKASVELRND